MAPAVFHIRGLKTADISPSAPHPTSPAAVQLPHESAYDDLVATEPTAKLSYIDDDDGEIITVGTSVELFSRIEELNAIKPVCFDLLASLRSTGAANNADGIRAWVRLLREPTADQDPAITVVDAKTPEEEAAAAEEEDWKTPFERELRGLMESQPPQAPADIVKHAMQSMRWATESALSETGPAVQNFQSVIKNALELMQTHVGRAAADGAERARQAADATRGLDLREVEEGRKAVLKLAEGLSQFAIGAGKVAGGFAEEVGREATAMARRTREDDRAFLHELMQVEKGKSPAPREPSPAPPPLTRVSPRPEPATAYTEPADPAPVHKDSAFWQQMDKIASAKNATVEDAEDEDNEILAQMYDQVFNPPPPISYSPPPAPRAYSPPPSPRSYSPPPAPRWSPLHPAPYSPPPHLPAAPTLHSPPVPQHDPSARPPHSWLFGDDPRRHRHRHPHHHQPHHHQPRRFHHQHAGSSRHYIRERSASPPSQQPAYEFIRPSSVHRPQVPRPPSVPRPLSNPFDTPPRVASPPTRRSTSPFMRERNTPEMMMTGVAPVRVHSPPIMPGGFPEHDERERWDRCVAQLVDMGYGDGEVVEVARLAGGDVALACEMLEDERAALNAMGL